MIYLLINELKYYQTSLFWQKSSLLTFESFHCFFFCNFFLLTNVRSSVFSLFYSLSSVFKKTKKSIPKIPVAKKPMLTRISTHPFSSYQALIPVSRTNYPPGGGILFKNSQLVKTIPSTLTKK